MRRLVPEGVWSLLLDPGVIVVAVGCYLFLGGAVALAGWVLDLPRLTDWGGGGVAVQPNNALATLAFGAGLLVLASAGAAFRAGQRFDAAVRWVVGLFAALVASIGAATLCQHLLGVNLGIDRVLLFGREWGSLNVASPGRMGIPASTCWALLGLAMLGAAARPRSAAFPVPALALTTLAIAWVGLLGLLYRVDPLYSIPKYTAIAPVTTTFLLAGSVGLLAAMPHRDPARTVLADRGAAGRLARGAILPLLVLAPLVGSLRLYGEQAQWYDSAMGVVIMVVSLSLAPTFLLWRAGRNLSRHEAALNASEALARRIASVAPVILYIYDLREHRNVWGNKGMTDVLGYTRADVASIGEGLVAKLMHPDDLAAYQEHYRRLLSLRDDESAELEYRMRHADGAWRWLHSRDTIFARDAAGAPTQILGAAVDVTERKAAEDALRESQTTLSIARDAAALGIYDYEIASGAITWDQRLRELFEVGPDDRITFDLFLGRLHPDDRLPTQAAIDRSLDPAGDSRYVAEYRVVGPSGVTRWIAATGRVIRQPGRPVRLIGSVQDITGRRLVEEELRTHRERLEQLVRDRTAELDASHQRLRVSERMAAIGTLSAGLGHDMGNILMPLRVRLESLERLADSDAAQAEIEAIRSLIAYLQRLAGGLRMLAIDPSRRGSASDVTELRAWWTEAQTVMRTALPRTITLESRPADAPLAVALSKAGLTQAVFNLVQNAGDAMRDAPVGTVTVAFEQQGDSVLLSVSDTGPGMSEEVRRRCMEPFFTTKTRGLSTGLGLALVYGLVREARGAVELDSEPGRGTTFTLRFPAVPVPSAETPPSRHALISITDVRTRAFVAAELRHLGHAVHIDSAADGVSIDLVVVESSQTVPNPANVVMIAPGSRLADVRMALRDAVRPGVAL